MSDPGTPYAWAGRFVAVADEQLAAAYDMGVQDSMLRATQYERILLDLLAELRDEHSMDNGGCCVMCEDTSPCTSARACDWADARLREVSGE